MKLNQFPERVERQQLEQGETQQQHLIEKGTTWHAPAHILTYFIVETTTATSTTVDRTAPLILLLLLG